MQFISSCERPILTTERAIYRLLPHDGGSGIIDLLCIYSLRDLSIVLSRHCIEGSELPKRSPCTPTMIEADLNLATHLKTAIRIYHALPIYLHRLAHMLTIEYVCLRTS